MRPRQAPDHRAPTHIMILMIRKTICKAVTSLPILLVLISSPCCSELVGMSIPRQVPAESSKWMDLRPGDKIQATRNLREGVTIESCRLFTSCIVYRPNSLGATNGNSFQINKGEIYTVNSLIEQDMGSHSASALILKNESNIQLEIKGASLSNSPGATFSREHLNRIGFRILDQAE